MMVERFHITQDDYGYWMRVRQTGRALNLETWGNEHVDHVLIECFEHHASEAIEVYYSEAMPESDRRIGDESYTQPEPRRARRPYTVHNTRDDVPEER